MKRLQRITAAAPPAHTIDGQLQRWRDNGHEPAPADDPAPADVEPDVDAGRDAEDDEFEAEPCAAELEIPLPPPPRPRRENPAHRQAKPAPQTKVGELPWWAKADRESFTKQAEGKVEDMVKNPIAKSVVGKINEV